MAGNIPTQELWGAPFELVTDTEPLAAMGVTLRLTDKPAGMDQKPRDPRSSSGSSVSFSPLMYMRHGQRISPVVRPGKFHIMEVVALVWCDVYGTCWPELVGESHTSITIISSPNQFRTRRGGTIVRDESGEHQGATVDVPTRSHVRNHEIAGLASLSLCNGGAIRDARAPARIAASAR